MLRTSAQVMAGAVEFDGETCFGTIKIENIRANWMLPPKDWLA
jgi:hypothetical protein